MDLGARREPARGGEGRGPVALLGAASLLLVAATLAIDLPRSARGEFWGDSATVKIVK